VRVSCVCTYVLCMAHSLTMAIAAALHTKLQYALAVPAHTCVQCSKKPASGSPSSPPEGDEKVETTPLLKDVEKAPSEVRSTGTIQDAESTGTIQDAEESLEAKHKRDFQTIKVPEAAVSDADQLSA